MSSAPPLGDVPPHPAVTHEREPIVRFHLAQLLLSIVISYDRLRVKKSLLR